MPQVINNTAIRLADEYSSRIFEEKFKYDGNDLGATYTEGKTTFKVWSPIATKITLKLYKNGEPETSSYKSVELTKGERGVWSAEVNGDLENVYYTYTVRALGEEKETADIYAKACGVNGQRSMVVNLRTTNPRDWEKDNYTYDKSYEPIIYELHIKDFSYDKNSGISEANRGKYLAFTETGTCYKDDKRKPTGIDYLKKLGITHVHLLPMFDFASIDENGDNTQFNWGYDPLNYNVPEGSYSSDPHNGRTRIKEAKKMIKALHDAGIGVIMDVVYNHTYSEDSFFQRTVPYYYYRIDEYGNFSNGSGCGNETASERFMFRKYMVDSCMYWAKEYHIDGFRFDLMGLHDVCTMNTIRQSLNTLPNGENIIMYGEPWFASTPAMEKSAIPATKDNLKYLDTNIAIFSDDTRDSIKGSVFFDRDGGFINGKPYLTEQIRSAVTAWTNKTGMGVYYPRQIISYVSAHDNNTLYDKLVLSCNNKKEFKKIDKNIIKLNKFAATIIMTCCGSVFFQAGEEFGRTKEGDGNSYCSSPEINMLNWERAYENKELIDFYAGLIKFRKTVKPLMSKNIRVSKYIEFYNEDMPSMVHFVIKDADGEDALVVYNAATTSAIVEMPEGEWQIICDGNQVFTDHPQIFKNEIVMEKNSAIILRKKAKIN